LKHPHPLSSSGAWGCLHGSFRARSTNFQVEDIRRLNGRLLSGDPIPVGPACFVTPPSADVVTYEKISFRGLCSGSRSKGEPRELYFPLPYNQEQETIVEMLERAPGVSVQGPPGTGKTHTIGACAQDRTEPRRA
ncbi:MAG: hypothetical protein ACKO0Z_08470, partial [Betaproteobacteria bacterium]